MNLIWYLPPMISMFQRIRQPARASPLIVRSITRIQNYNTAGSHFLMRMVVDAERRLPVAGKIPKNNPTRADDNMAGNGRKKISNEMRRDIRIWGPEIW
jgi:hypothetical protein